MRTRVGSAVVVAALLAGGGWYVSGPYVAMSGLRNAAVSGDAAELSERVDFPALRESIRAQASGALSRAAVDGAGPIGAIGAMFASAWIGPAVDALVTPESIAAMVQGRAPGGVRGTQTATPAHELDVSTHWTSVSSVVAHVQGSEPGSPSIELTFAPRGGTWKLVGAHVPLEDFAPKNAR